MSQKKDDRGLNEAKAVSIVEYLNRTGVPMRSTGGLYFIKSPFSKDTNWSFCIYPDTNSFYDWSTGRYGDILDYVVHTEDIPLREAIYRLTNGNYPTTTANDTVIVKPPFDYADYINHNQEERKAIHRYAKSRGIASGYECGLFFSKEDNKNWVRHPSLMFIHRDNNLNISGAKFRDIAPKDNRRFYAKGKLGFYILENLLKDHFAEPVLYIVESETSANSLWQYCKETSRNCVVMSVGGVSSAPKELPDKYSKFKRKLIIDYDGDLKLYKERVKLYKTLECEDIKIPLEKGEDLNSLYVENKIFLIENLI